MRNARQAEIGMSLVTILWGLTFPVIRLGVSHFDGRTFVAYRFAIASIAFLPVLYFFKVSRRDLKASFPSGFVMGLFLSLTYLFQTIGLETVPSPRAAFITASYVIFVPFFSPLFGRGMPKRYDFVVALLALVGLYFILDPQFTGVTEGDFWVLGCAVCSGLSIQILGKLVVRPINTIAFAFWNVVGVTVASLLSLVTVQAPKAVLNQESLSALLVCALLVTVGAFCLQVRCQKFLSPERTALIYSMEPIFAVFFGYLILGELLTWKGAFGGLLILAAVGGEPFFSYIKKLRRAST